MGNIYIALINNRRKVGRAKDVEIRMKSLQTGCADKIEIEYVYEVRNEVKLENIIHIVKLPREIWMLIFDYKQINFKKQVWTYIDRIFKNGYYTAMSYPHTLQRPPRDSSLDELTRYKLEEQDGGLILTYNGLLIAVCYY